MDIKRPSLGGHWQPLLLDLIEFISLRQSLLTGLELGVSERLTSECWDHVPSC